MLHCLIGLLSLFWKIIKLDLWDHFFACLHVLLSVYHSLTLVTRLMRPPFRFLCCPCRSSSPNFLFYCRIFVCYSWFSSENFLSHSCICDLRLRITIVRIHFRMSDQVALWCYVSYFGDDWRGASPVNTTGWHWRRVISRDTSVKAIGI